jgi:hypothetical protein
MISLSWGIAECRVGATGVGLKISGYRFVIKKFCHYQSETGNGEANIPFLLGC